MNYCSVGYLEIAEHMFRHSLPNLPRRHTTSCSKPYSDSVTSRTRLPDRLCLMAKWCRWAGSCLEMYYAFLTRHVGRSIVRPQAIQRNSAQAAGQKSSSVGNASNTSERCQSRDSRVVNGLSPNMPTKSRKRSFGIDGGPLDTCVETHSSLLLPVC